MSGSRRAEPLDARRDREEPWRARLVERLKRHRAVAGSLLTLALKIGGTGLMMVIFLMAARSMSPQGFGQLAVTFNALSFLAVLAVFGQDVLFVRSWGEYTSTASHGLALGAYRFGWSVVLAASIVFGLATLALGALDPHHRFTPIECVAGAAFLAMQILLLFTVQTTRVVVNFVVSETNRELTWRAVLFPVVAVGLWKGLDETVFFGTAAVGMAIAIALQVRTLNRRLPAEVRAARPTMRRREWIWRAAYMWSSAILEAAAQYAEVLLLGFFLSPSTAGLYFVAARIANVFAMLSSGLHSYTVTHCSNLYHAGQMAPLQAIIRAAMSMSLLTATPLLVVIVVLGQLLLNIFGHHYSDAYWVLLVLSIGSFMAASAGPSSAVLLVTGHEKLYSRVLFVALLIRVGLIGWAAPRYGALGVAAIWTSVNGPVAVGLAWATRRLTGIDPSIVSLLGRPLA